MGSRAGRADLDPSHYPPLHIATSSLPQILLDATAMRPLSIYIIRSIRTSIAPIPSYVAMSASSSVVVVGCQVSFLHESRFERQRCRGDDMEITCVNKHRWSGWSILSDGWCLDVIGLRCCWSVALILADLVGNLCQCRRFKTAGGAYLAIHPEKGKIAVLCQGSSGPE